MKKYLFLIIVSLLTISAAKAQVFIVESGSTSTTYADLESAVAAAHNDDNLYIPAGIHNIKNSWLGYDGEHNFTNTLFISKRLNIIGAGYNQGSQSSIIQGKIIFAKQASKSTITGILFNDAVYADSISNMMISRCKFRSWFNLSGVGDNNIIKECRFDVVVSQGFIYITGGPLRELRAIFSKNIFSGGTYSYDHYSISNIASQTFVNNLFRRGRIHCFMSNFENNIICLGEGNASYDSEYSLESSNSGNIFRNNLFVDGHLKLGDGNSLENNIVDQKYSTVFVNPESEDFHLQDMSQGKNAGNDGTDVGIYGTAFPFKENCLPSIPYFSLLNVASETDANQKLKVDIKIEAQER